MDLSGEGFLGFGFIHNTNPLNLGEFKISKQNLRETKTKSNHMRVQHSLIIKSIKTKQKHIKKKYHQIR